MISPTEEKKRKERPSNKKKVGFAADRPASRRMPKETGGKEGIPD